MDIVGITIGQSSESDDEKKICVRYDVLVSHAVNVVRINMHAF